MLTDSAERRIAIIPAGYIAIGYDARQGVLEIARDGIANMQLEQVRLSSTEFRKCRDEGCEAPAFYSSTLPIQFEIEPVGLHVRVMVVNMQNIKLIA